MARRTKATRKSTNQRIASSPIQAEPIDQPTPEQGARVTYLRTVHTDEMGVRVGMGYRREPLFETMAKKSANAITRDELAALQFYRGAFDGCEMSMTRSCLNVSNGAGLRDPGSALASITPAVIEAKRKLRLCEDVLGLSLATMRAIVLHDRSISDVAIERFGGRKQDWIIVNEPVFKNGRQVRVDGKPLTRAVSKERIVPKSGRHRDAISKEFHAGLRLLTKRVRFLVSTPGIEEVWIEPGQGAARAMIRRGVAAPNGLYRLWGHSEQVDDLMSRLRDVNGEGLSFPTPQDARAALDEADGGRLLRLSNVEMGA